MHPCPLSSIRNQKISYEYEFIKIKKLKHQNKFIVSKRNLLREQHRNRNHNNLLFDF